MKLKEDLRFTKLKTHTICYYLTKLTEEYGKFNGIMKYQRDLLVAYIKSNFSGNNNN